MIGLAEPSLGGTAQFQDSRNLHLFFHFKEAAGWSLVVQIRNRTMAVYSLELASKMKFVKYNRCKYNL